MPTTLPSKPPAPPMGAKAAPSITHNCTNCAWSAEVYPYSDHGHLICRLDPPQYICSQWLQTVCEKTGWCSRWKRK